jgi:spore maturation protein SpmB
MKTGAKGSVTERLRACLAEGVAKGARSGVRLLAIMLPVSFLVMLLDWSGALRWSAQWVAPLFSRIGLPGEAALAFITAAFINLYAGIAAMSAMTLTARQLTILAVICLISHNLPVEVAIQHKAGSSGPRLLFTRLLASAAAGFVLNRIMPAGPSEPLTFLASGPPTFRLWLLSTGHLAVKVMLIIVGLMVLLRLLTEFGLIRRMTRPLLPLLRLLGLPPGAAFLWIVANTLGLAYGAGVILEEVRTGAISKRDVDLLNHSIAVCHSLLEDTLLFVVLGAWWIWIIVPRLLLAAAVVWLKRLEYYRRGPVVTSKAD